MLTASNDLGDNQLTVYESKHKGSYVLAPHQHEIHQILYVIDGSGEIMLENKWIEFSQDHLAMITPNTMHAVQSESSLTLLVIAFGVQDYVTILPEHFFQQYYPQSFVIRLKKNRSREMKLMLRKMLFLKSHPTLLEQIAARLQLCEVLVYLAKTKEYITNTNFPAKVSRIKDYIERNYYEIQSANQIANQHQLSVRYMDDLFKAHMQKTPIQYLMEVRIARAKTLLKDTEHEIISICFEVGFENVSTFYRSFKQSTGLTPYQYRTQNK